MSCGYAILILKVVLILLVMASNHLFLHHSSYVSFGFNVRYA